MAGWTSKDRDENHWDGSLRAKQLKADDKIYSQGIEIDLTSANLGDIAYFDGTKWTRFPRPTGGGNWRLRNTSAGALAWTIELATVVTASGTYTPTLTNTANLDSSTAFECQYLQVGNTVTVSGRVSVDPTLTATVTQLGISLPVASNIGALSDVGGVAFASGIAGQGAAIGGDSANNRAIMQWVSTDVTDQSMYFTFSYQVI